MSDGEHTYLLLLGLQLQSYSGVIERVTASSLREWREGGERGRRLIK